MKLGIDSFSYHLHLGKHWFTPTRTYDLRWYCDACRQLGADGLHIDPAHVDLARDAEWLADYAGRHGLYAELGGWGVSRGELAPWIEAAARMGSGVLRTFVGGSCAQGPAATAARARAARTQLADVLDLAERHGVCIAVENHGDLFLADMLALMELDSPYLGVCYDSGNFAAVGEDPVEALDVLIDRVVCTHLKDVCPADRFPDAKPFGLPDRPTHFCALGDGVVPLESLVDRLRRAKGEAVHVTIEIHSAWRRNLDEAALLAFEGDSVARSVTYAREVLRIREARVS